MAFALLLMLATHCSAMQTASNPTPSLFDSDFFIKPTPILKPWGNGSTAVEGSSVAVGANCVGVRVRRAACGVLAVLCAAAAAGRRACFFLLGKLKGKSECS